MANRRNPEHRHLSPTTMMPRFSKACNVRRVLLLCLVLLALRACYVLMRGDTFVSSVTYVANSTSTTPSKPLFPWKPVKVQDADCSKIFYGNKLELKRALALTRNLKPDKNVTAEVSRGCDVFLRTNRFFTSHLTTEELNFPIAYSMLVYKDAAQVLGLLRAIYRPQNFVCIHVDSKSPETFRSAVKAMAGCLPNVFLSSRSVNVMWGYYTVLEPEFICMRDLIKHKGWKYFINLTGQEFPLKTNLEIVRILTALQGANDVSTSNNPSRWRRRWESQLPAPENLTIAKGSVHVALNRYFVQYVLSSPVAAAFRNWSRRVKIPDELFFNTLNTSPHLAIPGTFNGSLPHVDNQGYVTRFKHWKGSKDHGNFCAAGLYNRDICILTAGDLPNLHTRQEMFANKFWGRTAASAVAMECLAEKLFNRTRGETLGTLQFDADYYRHLPFLNHTVPVPNSTETVRAVGR